MSERDLQPLPDDLASLLAAERARPGLPPAMKAKLLDGVRTAVSLPPTPPSPGSPKAASPGSPLSADTVRGLRALVRGGGVIKGIALFVAGGVTGAGAHLVISDGSASAPPAVVAPETTLAPSPATNTLPPLPAIEPPGLETARPTSVGKGNPTSLASPNRPKPGPENDGELAAERALVERARTAFGRGEDGLEALNEHAARFPDGQLAQEREALSVQGLVRRGRFAEARARAAAFKTKFPDSMLTPVVDAALTAADGADAPRRSP